MVAVDNPFLNQFQDIEARLVVSYSVDMYWFDYAGVKVFFFIMYSLSCGLTDLRARFSLATIYTLYIYYERLLDTETSNIWYFPHVLVYMHVRCLDIA